eukprot:jgi/Bigna1/140734/aug1.58_g15442
MLLMPDIDGNTPLHVACFMAQKASVDFLLENGASKTSVNKERANPFDMTKLRRPADDDKAKVLAELDKLSL